MEVEEFKEKLKAKIEKGSIVFQQPVIGCTEEEIDEFQSKLPDKMPKIYREFLLIAGKKVGNPLFEKAICLQYFEWRREMVKQMVNTSMRKEKIIYFSFDSNIPIFVIENKFMSIITTFRQKKDIENEIYKTDIFVSGYSKEDDCDASEYALSEFILNDFQSKWSFKIDDAAKVVSDEFEQF